MTPSPRAASAGAAFASRSNTSTTTLRQIGVPMILTTVSTAAGFLSLLVTDVRPIRQMGLFAAAGFFAAVGFFKARVAASAASARIVAVADAYDAMASNRPYRQGMPIEKIEAIFRSGAGQQWDPDIVEALMGSLDDIQAISQSEGN